MNCRHIKKSLSERLGDLDLDERERSHLESCPDCLKYYQSLERLERSLRGVEVEPLSEAELVSIRDRIDEKIDRYLSRATGFYRLAVRYGTSLAAVILLLAVSLVSGLYPVNKGKDVTELQLSRLLDEPQILYEAELDNGYFSLVLDDYTHDYGFSTAEEILGELSDEEFDFLMINIDIGGIL